MDTVHTKERWRVVETTFMECTGQVMDLLQYLLVQCAGQQGIVLRSLKCLGAWIQFGVSLADLFSRPLLNSVFNVIEQRRGPAFRAAVDVVGDCFINPIMPHHTASLLAVCGRVGALRPMLMAALREDDEATVQDLVLLATSIGENQGHILSEPHEEALALCDFITLAMTSPHWEIAETTFDFWLKLQDHLTRIKPPTVVGFVPASRVLAEQNKETARKSKYVARFVGAVNALLALVTFPPEREVRDWSSADFDELRLHREAVADVFVAASIVMEAEILSMASEMLKGHLQRGDRWELVEAVLFMTQTVVGWHHTVDENLHLVFAIIPQLPRADRVVSMTLTLIGVSALWLKMHQDLLPPSLQFVLEALARDYAGPSTTHSNLLSSVPSGAPQALLDLASICGGLMTTFIPEIIKVYNAVVANVDPQGKCTVVRSITHIISHLPVTEIGAAIEWTVNPIRARLDVLLRDPGGWGTKADLQALRAEITLLSCSIPFHVEPTSPDKALAISQAYPIASVWPYVNQLLSNWHQHFVILEAVVEFFPLLFEFFHVSICVAAWGDYLEGCLFAFRAGRYSHLLDSIVTIANTILGKADTYTPLEAAPGSAVVGPEGVVVAASEVVSSVAAADELRKVLATRFQPIFEAICDVAVPAIKESRGAAGDLTESFYKLVACVMENFPEVLVASPSLPSIIEAALLELGLPAQQVRSSQAVVDCLVQLTLSFEKFWGEPLRAIFARFGAIICKLVLLSLVGPMPWHSFNPLADVLWNLIAEFREECRGWLVAALQAPDFVTKNPLTPQVKEEFVDAVSTCSSHRKFRTVVSDFAVSCRS